MNPQFFGPDNSKLFGTLQTARGGGSLPARAVVICPPIGQEYIRSHWCLRLLAGQLARKGVHVLRFDYFGIGDSTGSSDDVERLETWQSNIGSAIELMQNEFNVDSVTLFGLRAGATLAANVALESDNVHSLVMWEPVWDGGESLNELRHMHSEMLDLWVCKMETENGSDAEEILGSRYCRSLLNEFEQLKVDWQAIEQPHLVFDVDEKRELYDSLSDNRMRKVELIDEENSWNDLKQLETAWLRPLTTRSIVTHAVDMFDRLERFEILGGLKVEV